MNRHQSAIDQLIRELDDLERQHVDGAIDDDELVARSDRYTARLAALIRSGSVEGRSRRGRRPFRRSIALVLGAMAFAGAIHGAASLATKDDVARSVPTRSLPNDTAVADGTPVDGVVPIDRETMLTDAAIAAEQGLLVEAADRYNALLDTNPNDAVALAHYGWMLSRAAASNPTLTTLAGDASALLDRAVAADPELPDARWFRAVVRTTNGDIEGAQADLAAFVELSPEAADDRAVGELKAELETQAQLTQTAGSSTPSSSPSE